MSKMQYKLFFLLVAFFVVSCGHPSVIVDAEYVLETPEMSAKLLLKADGRFITSYRLTDPPIADQLEGFWIQSKGLIFFEPCFEYGTDSIGMKPAGKLRRFNRGKAFVSGSGFVFTPDGPQPAYFKRKF